MTVTFLLWLIIGALLLVAEITTGTFYLLIFGIAAWAGAGLAYGGHGLNYQLAAAGLTSVAGLVAFRYLKQRRPPETASNVDLDIGNEVRVESVDGFRLKVQYRGSSWDALMEDQAGIPMRVGDAGIIQGARGNVLIVRPASR